MVGFQPQTLSTDITINLIEKYSTQGSGDQLRQQFIENLCKTNFVDSATSYFPKMS